MRQLVNTQAGVWHVWMNTGLFGIDSQEFRIILLYSGLCADVLKGNAQVSHSQAQIQQP